MLTLSSHHAALLAKFCCSIYRGQSTSILSVIHSPPRSESRRLDRISRHGRPRPLRRRLAPAMLSPGRSPSLRLLMGNRARMGFDVFDAIDNIKHFPDLDAHLRQKFFPHHRYLSLSMLKHSATPDDRQVPFRAVKCDKTFRYSRRSPSSFSRSEPPV